MNNKFNVWPLIFCIAIPLCVGIISSLITGDMMKEYSYINKPPLSPPSWVFPVVWTILYIMMGLASYMVITSNADNFMITQAILFYSIQLLLNFFWSLLFFRYSLYLWSFIELCAMWIFILITILLFFRIRSSSGILMIPYIIWSSFALYLNYSVYRLSIASIPLAK